MRRADLASRHCVEDGKKFRLIDVDPFDTGGLEIEKDKARELLTDSLEDLNELQERLYCEGERAVLVVLQAMDAGGKDSAIVHVMMGIAPQDCDVKSFRQPGPVERRHDFLWRHAIGLPQRGKVVIFNRSHYEGVLVARSPRGPRGPKPAEETAGLRHLEAPLPVDPRLRAASRRERHDRAEVPKDEQARRVVDRIDEPDKSWKFSFGDLEVRKRWDEYMEAYEDVSRNTATEDAPWHVVSPNNR